MGPLSALAASQVLQRACCTVQGPIRHISSSMFLLLDSRVALHDSQCSPPQCLTVAVLSPLPLTPLKGSYYWLAPPREQVKGLNSRWVGLLGSKPELCASVDHIRLPMTSCRDVLSLTINLFPDHFSQDDLLNISEMIRLFFLIYTFRWSCVCNVWKLVSVTEKNKIKTIFCHP